MILLTFRLSKNAGRMFDIPSSDKPGIVVFDIPCSDKEGNDIIDIPSFDKAGNDA